MGSYEEDISTLNEKQAKAGIARLKRMAISFSDNLSRLKGLHLSLVDDTTLDGFEPVLSQCSSLEFLAPYGVFFPFRRFMNLLTRSGVGRTLKRLFLPYPGNFGESDNHKLYPYPENGDATFRTILLGSAAPNILTNSISQAHLFPKFHSLKFTMLAHTHVHQSRFRRPGAPCSVHQRFLLLIDIYIAQKTAAAAGVHWAWDQEYVSFADFRLSSYEASYLPGGGESLHRFFDWLARMLSHWGQDKLVFFPGTDDFCDDMLEGYLIRLGRDWIAGRRPVNIHFEGTRPPVSHVAFAGGEENAWLHPRTQQLATGEQTTLAPAAVSVITNLRLSIKDTEADDLESDFPPFIRRVPSLSSSSSSSSLSSSPSSSPTKWQKLPHRLHVAIVNRAMTNRWSEALKVMLPRMDNLEKLTLDRQSTPEQTEND